MNDGRQSIPESVVLPPKEFLTMDQLLELWDIRGMKYRFDDFYKFCTQRGLNSVSLHKQSFRKKIFGVLRSFLVEGDVRRDPRFVEPKKPEKLV